MQRGLGVIGLLSALLIVACTQQGKVEGTVSDITENTITIVTTDGSLVTFSTRDAKVTAPAGIHRGSPVTVGFKEEIADGFGNAKRVVVPEEYNLLIGRWMAPCDEYHESMHGFELMPDGEVLEIGDHSIIYNFWKYANGKLSMAEYRNHLDEEIFDMVHHWHIEYLDRSTLTISGYGYNYTFARSSR